MTWYAGGRSDQVLRSGAHVYWGPQPLLLSVLFTLPHLPYTCYKEHVKC